MRVLHVTAGNLFGGIERMLVTLAASLDDHHAHAFAVSFDGRLARELRACGHAPHVIGDARFSRPLTIWRARRNLRRVIGAFAPDAVIAHAPWSCALATPVARRMRVPVWMWVHDLPHPEQFLERRVASRPPHRFICNSHFTAGATGAWLPAVPRDVIHPAVAPLPRVSDTDRRTLRVKEGADDDSVVVFMAARLQQMKGHRVLIEAARTLRGKVMLWMAGGPQQPHEVRYLESLRQLAVESLPAGRVRFLGERSDVPRLMHAADVYCQPNTEPDSFGIVFVEALAAGRPVVTTAIGGAVEIVGERYGILVPHASAEAVGAALQTLIDDPSLRASLGQDGPARAFALCDPAGRLREIDETVCHHRASPDPR